MKYSLLLIPILLILSSFTVSAPIGYTTQIATLKYNGGGDWYSNPTALKNLAAFCNDKIDTQIDPDYGTVEVGSVDLYNYSFVHMTGHGNVVFSDAEAENLRNYLIGGGFLHIDDNYGMDPYVRVSMKQLPKIHKHDDKPAQGYGIIYEGRLVCFYSYESDLGDGWEDFTVHKDPEEVRKMALTMGANLIEYAFTQD